MFAGSPPITSSSPPSKARQKSGPFPPPALPGLNGRMALSDSRPTRRLCDVGAASPRQDGSPPMTRIPLPPCRAPYPGGSRRVHGSIASPLTRPSPFPRRVGIRIFTFEMLWGGRWGDVTIVAGSNAMERPMAQQLDDLSRSLTPPEQESTIMAVIEMSQASWLVAGIVPGIERHPLKKLYPAAKTDADRCCWARLPSPTASATHTELGPRRVLRDETSRKAGCGKSARPV